MGTAVRIRRIAEEVHTVDDRELALAKLEDVGGRSEHVRGHRAVGHWERSDDGTGRKVVSRNLSGARHKARNQTLTVSPLPPPHLSTSATSPP